MAWMTATSVCWSAGDELVARFSRSLIMLGWKLMHLKRGPVPDRIGQFGRVRLRLRALGACKRTLLVPLCDVHCSSSCLSQRTRQDDLRHEETARRLPYTAARIYCSCLLLFRRRRRRPASHRLTSARAIANLPPALPFAPSAPPSLFSLTSTHLPHGPAPLTPCARLLRRRQRTFLSHQPATNTLVNLLLLPTTISPSGWTPDSA
jgi:hypothetical protein